MPAPIGKVKRIVRDWHAGHRVVDIARAHDVDLTFVYNTVALERKRGNPLAVRRERGPRLGTVYKVNQRPATALPLGLNPER